MKYFRIAVLALFLLTGSAFGVFYLAEQRADKTLPSIAVEGELLQVSLQADGEELKTGVSAYDEKDGDISHKVIVESISNFIEPGLCTVTYAVCDGDKHTAVATRRIQYVDYEAPRFTMSASLVFNLAEQVDILGRVGAADLIDGDISDRVIVTATDYQSNTVGVFQISMQVSNSKGDVIYLDLPIYIENLSLSAPEILLGEHLLYVPLGGEVDARGNFISATDSDGNDVSDGVMVDTDLNTARAGVYQVHYYAADALGRQGHEVLTVVVED